MTIIQDRIEDVAGAGLLRNVTVSTQVIRQAATGDAIVATVPHHFELADGVLSTTDLDPGPAVVQIGAKHYNIVIPVSATPIRLWPLIDAGMPPPPPAAEGFIRTDGVIRRDVWMLKADFDQLTSLDPSTRYNISDI